ncbi:hypothetical protein BH11ACT4_BH11ACT4_16600 [soil metagenome]
MNGTTIVLPLALLLVAAVTQLAANGVIKRNGFVGIRIPSTLGGDAAWLAGHKAAVAPVWIGFAAATVIGVWDILTGDSMSFTVAAFVVFVATLAFSVYAASRGARAASEFDQSRTG